MLLKKCRGSIDMVMDMCLPKFDIYKGAVAPNCFKSHTNLWSPNLFNKSLNNFAKKLYRRCSTGF